jgi:hypothetical protein
MERQPQLQLLLVWMSSCHRRTICCTRKSSCGTRTHSTCGAGESESSGSVEERPVSMGGQGRFITSGRQPLQQQNAVCSSNRGMTTTVVKRRHLGDAGHGRGTLGQVSTTLPNSPCPCLASACSCASSICQSWDSCAAVRLCRCQP